MKQTWLVILVILLAMLAVCAAIGAIAWFAIDRMGTPRIQIGPIDVASSPFSAEETIQESFPVSGLATLDLDSSFGDMIITADPQVDQIQVTAHKQSNGGSQAAADQALADLNLSMAQDGDRLTIRVEQPPRLRITTESAWVDFTIIVPEQTSVQAHTRSGEVTLNGTQGDTNLSSNFGSVSAADLKGDLTIQSSSGEVSATRIQAGDGQVEIDSDFGDIRLEDVTAGSIRATSNSGAIRLISLQASGLVEVNCDYGPVTFEKGRAGSFSAHLSSGKLSLYNLNVSGELSVDAGFGDIILSQASAQSYNLETQSGAVEVDGASGTLRARSGFGSIDVRRGEAVNLDLSTQSGRITYEGSLGDGPHTLQSDFGEIRLVLPAGSSFNFDLKTDFGRIQSDFEVTMSGAVDEQHWIGSVGDGGSSLSASSKGGGIFLESRPE